MHFYLNKIGYKIPEVQNQTNLTVKFVSLVPKFYLQQVKCIIFIYFMIRKMLMTAFKVLVYELFLTVFYKKIIKQLIFLSIFYIFHKNNIKIFKI